MESKQNKNTGVTYFALAFIVALLFELYFILNDPTNYFMLIGIGIVLVITGYLTFDALERIRVAKEKAEAEQSDLMVKAGKAIYLATKRNSQEAEKQHLQNLKAIELMMNKMISNDKEMVNALIAQNEEIAAKQITTTKNTEPVGTDMSALIEQLSASNAKLAKEVQSAITVNELVKANADLVKNVREVLENSSGMSRNNIASYVTNAVPEIQVQVPTQNVNVAPPVQESTAVEEVGFDTSDDSSSFSSLMDDILEDDSLYDDFELDDNFNISGATTNNVEDMSNNMYESLNNTSDIAYDEKTMDEFDFESFDIADNTSDTVLESGEEVTPQELVDDINISALNDMVVEEGSVVAPAISEELDEEMSQGEAESVLSGMDPNPNRQLTEAEIAALFANL